MGAAAGVTWPWLAGFTDGDGYINIADKPERRGFGVVRIVWSQKRSEEQVLISIRNFLAGQGLMAAAHQTSVACAGRGSHGAGAVLCCADCGSRNIVGEAI